GLAIDLIQAGGVRQVARKDGQEDHGEDQAPDGQHRAPVEQAADDGSARACSTLLVAVGSAVVARHEHPSMPATWTLDHFRFSRNRLPLEQWSRINWSEDLSLVGQASNQTDFALAVPVAGENAPVFDHGSVCAYFAERMARRASQTPFPPPFSTASPAWVSAARYASGARLP